jgi:hypothetical protein
LTDPVCFYFDDNIELLEVEESPKKEDISIYRKKWTEIKKEQQEAYLRAGFLLSKKPGNPKRERDIMSEKKRIQVEKEFQVLLKGAQEFSKAKFVKMKTEW